MGARGLRYRLLHSTTMNIKEKWKEHPLYKRGKIELVPTDWVWKYRGTDVSPGADLVDGTPATMEELWENILEVGLCDPLIMRVGLRNNKFRLESGNHRIQIFHAHGVPVVPLTVEIRGECGPHLSDVMTDATHNFDASPGFLISDATEEYMKPSDVFRDLKEDVILRV
jgi:hypothetical protein